MAPPPVELNLYEWSDDAEDLPLWEISPPYKTSLYWSIQIPYLIEAVASGNFAEHLSIFIGEGQTALKIAGNNEIPNLERKIKNINPFKSNDAVYKTEDFSRLMQNFKTRLNRLTQNLEREKNMQYNDFLKLQAAANALKSTIYLCMEESNKKQIKCFTPVGVRSYESSRIKIYIVRRGSDGKFIYGYGFKGEKSENSRKKSLRHFLKLAKINLSEIEEVIKLWPCDKFILKLLKNSIRDVIIKVYELPFILKKLNEASFDMNPLSTGEDGYSAFHHCILLNDWNLFIILYNHVILKFPSKRLQSDHDLSQWTKLNDLFTTEENEYRKTSHSSDKNEKVINMYQQVKCFNKYQFEVIGGILNKKNPENHEYILMHLISKYFKFFTLNNLNFAIPHTILFKDFCETYEYYETLDDFTCLQFFDNFLSLKVHKDDSNKTIYKNVLTSILWYFLSRITFKRSYNNDYSDNMGELFIVFSYRLKWKNSLTVLNNNLGRPPPPTSDSLHYIAALFLDSNPLLKDHFQLLRLKQYLKIGIEASLDNNVSSKGALIIERTLQVIGETIFQIKYDNCDVTSLLKYCLPPNLLKVLVKIRHRCLSHCGSYYVKARSYFTQEQCLKSVQEEIKKMEGAFKSIFRIQDLRMKREMLTQSLQESESDNGVYNHLTLLIEETNTIQKDFYNTHKNNYFSYTNKIFDALVENFYYWENGGKETFKKDFNSLNYLLMFIAENSEDFDSNTFSNDSNKIKNAIETNDEKECVKLLLEEIKQIFKVRTIDFVTSNCLVDGDFPSLNKLFEIMENIDILTSEDQTIVRKSLLENSNIAKQRLVNHFKKKEILDKETVVKLWGHLLVEDKTKQEIKKKIKKNYDEALSDLENVVDKVDLLLGKENNISFTFMKMLENKNYTDVIPNLRLTKSLHDKISRLNSQRLHFVNERMIKLREILINDNKTISSWNKSAHTDESKDYTEKLLIKRYMTEMDTKAAVEMILLDCFEVFNKKDFDELVKKTSSVFYDINLRDFLSHGYPILEMSCDLLDPTNLAREIIRKSLDLIEEQSSISALIEFRRQKQCPTKEKLREFLTSDNIPKNSKDIVNQIKKSPKWENYLNFFHASYKKDT